MLGEFFSGSILDDGLEDKCFLSGAYCVDENDKLWLPEDWNPTWKGKGVAVIKNGTKCIINTYPHQLTFNQTEQLSQVKNLSIPTLDEIHNIFKFYTDINKCLAVMGSFKLGRGNYWTSTDVEHYWTCRYKYSLHIDYINETVQTEVQNSFTTANSILMKQL